MQDWDFDCDKVGTDGVCSPPYLVIFVVFVSLVRNATVGDKTITNDRFHTKSTKVHKDHQAEGIRRSLYQLLALPFRKIKLKMNWATVSL